MGLRLASEVPPFYFLEDLRDQDGREVMMSALQRGGRYTAKRVDLTIDDIIRAMGKREPASDAAAADLRMGVLLLAAPGTPPGEIAGEAFRIDAPRLWNEFYNAAGGGRGGCAPRCGTRAAATPSPSPMRSSPRRRRWPAPTACPRPARRSPSS
jgi:hypothetical protein